MAHFKSLFLRLSRRYPNTDAVERQPAVALIGPRQVGKTPWPLDIAEQRPTVYLDFEAPVEDRYALSQGVAAIGVRELAEEFAGS